MALDDTDRRRFVIAAIVSMLALPALWWANRDDGSAGPNLATAGVEVRSESAPDRTVADRGTDESNLPSAQTVGGSDPVFLEGPVPNPVGVSEIAVPAGGASESTFTEATYRSSVVAPDSCLSKTLPQGRTVTVINLDNNRTTTCVIRLAPATQVDDLVLHTDQFVELADLTDAPIPVEVRP